MTSADRSDSTIGPYRLVRLLGRGGMGEVYEAIDTVKDRTVALKLLPPGLAGDDAFRARFMRESQTVARLNDPHIIPIHDFGEIDGRLFLDMRIVHGRDLRARIDDGLRDPGLAVHVIEQVAAALDTAHASGLLHRDVKPENILLDGRDFAYLADFGLAQAAGQTRLTSTGMAIGSFAYMAPERFGSETPVSPRSDVYALACVLYECLTGSTPYPSTSIEQVIAGHLSRPVPPTGTPFDAVIAAGTAKDPADRIASAGAFAAAARAALTGQRPAAPIPAAPIPAAPIPPHAPTMVAPKPVPTPTTAPRSSRARNGVIAAGVAAVVLLAAGTIAWLYSSGTGGPDTAAATSTLKPAPVTQTATVGGTGTVDGTGDRSESTLTESAHAEPTPVDEVSPVPGLGAGDLGLPTPISRPSCNGQAVTVVYNAVTPGAYAAEIAAALARYPGAAYLRTDHSCASLKQSENGNPVYAVYYPGSSPAAACATTSRLGGGAYTRRLDDVTPVGTDIC
ncbi:serine/threonine-protein kinase [Gordonia sihwensis]|uniref:serine/threonine-protein kinase n=1 Tax=Gordonia TaxID=2053 RepID=UPI002417858E|nr:serine/threonine-protein kinase [Gordonia sihwensis]WFN93726.1 serine/threonine-protein kinase [Gordonia sihwensis]